MDVYYSRIAAMHLKDAEAKYNVRKANWHGPAPSPMMFAIKSRMADAIERIAYNALPPMLL